MTEQSELTALCAEVEKLRAEVARLRAQLEPHELVRVVTQGQLAYQKRNAGGAGILRTA